MTVTAEDTLTAARRLLAAAPAPVAVLDFASGHQAGGGFRSGASGQEEDLCRCSALYRCLLAAPGYYAAHAGRSDGVYTDRVIVAPGVPVFRDAQLALLDEPVLVDVLVCAAPNARRVPEPEALPSLLRSRIARIVEVAAVHGARRLVLGAWGCGVYRNDPELVAGLFRDEVDRRGGHVDEVVFAVLDDAPGAPTRAAFARLLS